MTVRLLPVLALFGALAGMLAPPAHAYLDAEAAYRMALGHHQPLGTGRPDYRLAMMLYCRADGDDHAGAAFAIGLLYASGKGRRRSDTRAGRWFRRAASLGHGEAREMADIYRRGGGVARCPNGWGRGGSAAAAMRAPPDIKALVEKLSPRFKLDPKLVLAVISVESAFQVSAVSSANAQGLMQLIPATAKRFGVRDPFDAVQNLRGGMEYLHWLLREFRGNVTFALAAYNAGENAVKRHGGIPPYIETQTYVRRIRRLYAAKTHPY
ncbi:MAG: transglycosylase SLT domain-containing protein [Alphaproteobacteria bacterium]